MVKPITKLTDAEVEDLYAQEAQHVGAYSLQFYWQELARREQANQTAEMIKLTRQLSLYNLWLTIAAISSLVATVLIAFFK